MPVRWLANLSELVNQGIRPEEAVRAGLPILKDGLGATDVFLIYGAESSFGSYGTGEGPVFNDIALWIIHRDLTSRRQPCSFDVRSGRVVNFRPASARSAADYIAALVPMSSTGEMLIARGPWRRGFGAARLRTLQAVLPTVALLLQRRLDAQRAQRQHHQLTALANISQVLSESEDPETVLTAIAGTIATVTGIDYISIDIANADGTIRLRCVNSVRPGTEELLVRWKRGAERPDPIRDEVLRTRKAVLLADVQNDERVPESGRNFFVRTLIRSTGVLPLLVKNELLGVLSIASHKPLELTSSQMELLQALAAQAASAVKGIELYRELAVSRQQLQRLNEQLQESMGIQHHLARTDALTGIPNRRYLEEAIEAECARAVRYEQPLSLVMADLDYLKEVNDTFSHQRGDELIRAVAHLARETCRQADMVARYGGDEFVFVLPATKLDEALAFAERFRRRVEQYAKNEASASPKLTVSLGVAQWDHQTMTRPAALISEADLSMYKAKTAGRNRAATTQSRAMTAA
jgi:diguanylate cyclase (GGDEF)-like protein